MTDFNLDVEQEETTQDQSADNDPQVQVDEPTQGAGPWAKDLQDLFADEDTRGQVDAFLREKVQPYVTKLEGQRAPEQAVMLYNDLNEDPASTFLILTEDLFGPEVAQSVVATLTDAYGEPEVEAPATELDAETEEPESEDTLDPRVAKWVQSMEAQEQERQYQETVKAIVEYDDSVDPELLDPFLIAADGDPAEAYKGYRTWVDAVTKQPEPDPEEEVQPEVAEAPAVMGSDVQTPSAPPTQKQYGTLDDALDDFLDETRSRPSDAPGTMGAV